MSSTEHRVTERRSGGRGQGKPGLPRRRPAETELLSEPWEGLGLWSPRPPDGSCRRGTENTRGQVPVGSAGVRMGDRRRATPPTQRGCGAGSQPAESKPCGHRQGAPPPDVMGRRGGAGAGPTSTGHQILFSWYSGARAQTAGLPFVSLGPKDRFSSERTRRPDVAGSG